MKEIALLISVFISIFGFSQDSSAILHTNSVQENYKSIYKRGQEKYKKLDYRSAITDFKLVLKLKPKHSKSKNMIQVVQKDLNNYYFKNQNAVIYGYDYEYYKRGLYNVSHNKLIEAISDYSNALVIDSNYVEAYNARGIAYVMTNENNNAILDFSKAISLDSTVFDFYFNRGLAKKKSGLFDDALSDYNKALVINPNLSSAYVGIGVIYSERKTFRDALFYYEKALQLSPEDGIIFHNIGNIKSQLGDLDAAIESFSSAVNYRPYSIAFVYLDRGVALIKLKDYDAAINDFDKSLLLNPKFPTVYFYRGKAKQLKGNISEGCDDIKKAIDLGFKIPVEEIIITCD